MPPVSSFFVSDSGENLEAEVQQLLAAGADLNQADEQGDTPLYRAICATGYKTDRGNLELVKLLLKSGADPNLGSRFGGTPLTEAVRRDIILS